MGRIWVGSLIFLMSVQSSTGFAEKNDKLICSLLTLSHLATYSAEDLRHPRKEFVHDTSRYALQVERNNFIRNQCAYGSCWAHSSLSIYENRARRKGVSVRLSEDYLIISQLLANADKFLTHKESKDGKSVPPYVTQGYFVTQTESLVEKYGLIPEEAWTARTKFSDDSAVGKRMILNLNLLLKQLHINLNSKKNPISLAAARKAVVQFLESYTGPLPTEFLFAGERHTPHSFRKKTIFNPFPEGKRVSVEIRENPRHAFEAIRNQLDKTGEPVLLAMTWTQTFVDHSRGIISVEAFNHLGSDPKTLIALAKETSDSGAGGHAVTIVDYEVDIYGDPVKFLVLNSHGENKGDHGYYHIYWDYLKHMGSRVLVYQNFVPKR